MIGDFVGTYKGPPKDQLPREGPIKTLVYFTEHFTQISAIILTTGNKKQRTKLKPTYTMQGEIQCYNRCEGPLNSLRFIKLCRFVVTEG